MEPLDSGQHDKRRWAPALRGLVASPRFVRSAEGVLDGHEGVVENERVDVDDARWSARDRAAAHEVRIPRIVITQIAAS